MAVNDPSLRQKSGRIKDARGRRVTQIDPVAMHLLHRHDEGIPHEVLRELAREIGIGKLADSWFGLCVGGIGFACAMLLLGDALIQLIRGSMLLGEFVQRALWYQGIWAIPFAFWRAARRSRFHRIRRAMLRHRRCPHCGYDLRMLPTDPYDGTTVCPECGCVWRLDDTQPAERLENVVSDQAPTGSMSGTEVRNDG